MPRLTRTRPGLPPGTFAGRGGEAPAGSRPDVPGGDPSSPRAEGAARRRGRRRWPTSPCPRPSREAGPVAGLLEGVDGEHAVRHRGRLVQRDPGQPVGDRAADVVEVGGLAADHHAQRDHRVVAAGQRLGHHRQLDRARPPGPPRRRRPRTPSPPPGPARPCGRPGRRASGWPRCPASARRPPPWTDLALRSPAMSGQTLPRPGRGRRAGGPSGPAWCAGSARSPGAAAPAAARGRSTASPYPSSPARLAGLLVSSRIERMPRSARICAPVP